MMLSGAVSTLYEGRCILATSLKAIRHRSPIDKLLVVSLMSMQYFSQVFYAKMNVLTFNFTTSFLKSKCVCKARFQGVNPFERLATTVILTFFQRLPTQMSPEKTKSCSFFWQQRLPTCIRAQNCSAFSLLLMFKFCTKSRKNVLE